MIAEGKLHAAVACLEEAYQRKTHPPIRLGRCAQPWVIAYAENGELEKGSTSPSRISSPRNRIPRCAFRPRAALREKGNQPTDQEAAVTEFGEAYDAMTGHESARVALGTSVDIPQRNIRTRLLFWWSTLVVNHRMRKVSMPWALAYQGLKKSDDGDRCAPACSGLDPRDAAIRFNLGDAAGEHGKQRGGDPAVRGR